MNRPARPEASGDAPAVIPRGVAHVPLKGPVQTRAFAFLTLPRFTLLAFTSAAEPLRVANQLTQRPLYAWRVVSPDGRPVASSGGIRLDPDQGLGPLPRDTTVLVCSGTDGGQAADRATLDWLRAHARHGGAVGAICTGSFTLARAGLLGDDPTTLHWENQAAFREMFGQDPLPQLYVLGKRHMACAGGEAATDMMLALIERDHGAHLASAVAEMLLHGRPRAATDRQKPLFPAQAARRHPALARVIAAMEGAIETPLDREALAALFGRSARHMERTFAEVLGESPSAFYLGLRLERARNLLAETGLPLVEVALATGFESRESFARAFRRRFGTSPSRFR